VGFYTRQQFTLLLILLGAAGVGFAVVHWRAAHPELVERLEQLDRKPPVASGGVSAAEPRAPRVTAPRPARGAVAGARPRRNAALPRAPKRKTAAADESRPPLDLNRATIKDLTRLPGVGAVLARRIVETREAAGRFGVIDDLGTVRGIRRATLERLRPFVGVME
jgi:competence ComEA-like helix-hairpin-helix protein